jgi:ABC-type Zn uptake system ZnuABC Zn-binding protein ZnuA
MKVVTTTATLADITRQIGGDHVEVESIMRGPEDVHNVSPKPSYVMSVKKAKLFIHAGLDAEAWAPLLVKSARNPNLLPGAAGNLDASRGIALKEVPDRGQLTRALGDIHVFGNTHYTLDPLNGVIIARTIADALKQLDPAHAAEFDSSYEAFAAKMRATTERLAASLEPYRGTAVVTYHRSWPYFLERFGLVSIGEIEPKPGISPGPRHLSQIADAMTAREAKVVIVETYSSRADAQTVADKVGGVAITLAQDVNALPEVTSYEALFEYNVKAIVEAFRRAGVPESKPEGDDSAAKAGS